MALRFDVKKDKGERTKRWLAIFIGFIMLASVIGFVFSFTPAQANFRYGKLDFKQLEQGGYVTEISGRQLYFSYMPEEASGIVNVTGSIANLLTNSRLLWITYDWNSTIKGEMATLQFDVATLLDARRGVFVQPAFTAENPLNVSVKNCKDATSFVPVLLLQEANSTEISADGANPSCIVLNATLTDFQLAADRLKYAIIGEGK